MSEEKKKGGRPRQFEGRVQVATRLTPRVHRLLSIEAVKSGRSLSEEIEWRLSVSLLTRFNDEISG